LALFSRAGLTSIGDAGVGNFAHELDFIAFQRVFEKYNVPLRITAMPVIALHSRQDQILYDIDPKWKIGAYKIIADGSIQAHTACLSKEYHDQPGCCGMLTQKPEKLLEYVKHVHREGRQVAIHANGDVTIKLALDCIEAAQIEFPRPDARHRLEHCQTPSLEDLDRMKKLGVMPNFFVTHTYWWGDFHRDFSLGPDRAPFINPLRTALDKGIVCTIHSDSPITHSDPMLMMWCAVNRTTRTGKVLGPDERVTPYEALKLITLNAAYFQFEEKLKGSLEIGKLGDLSILSENPLTFSDIRLIKPLGTVVGGKFNDFRNSPFPNFVKPPVHPPLQPKL